MKKYIRTKDGIFEVGEEEIYEQQDETCKLVGYWVYPNSKNEKYRKYNLRFIPCEKVVAQADTIEELCDELVYDDKAEGKPFILEKEKDNWIINDYKKGKCKDDIIYGAIWTSKGLIYVAKMNDEGELELL